MIKRIVLPLLLIIVGQIQAQELTIKSFEPLPNDMTAQNEPVLDNEGMKCALIKIEANNLKGIKFPREDHYKEYYDEKEGLYLVYVSVGFPWLKFEHTEFNTPEQVNLESLNKEEELIEGRTYLMQLNVPISASNTIIVLKVQPAKASVTFNNKKITPAGKGIYEFPVQPDTYQYSIESDDYIPVKGSVTVEKGEKKTITKRLQPIMHMIDVNCNVGNSQVYVDNVLYGNTGKIRMPQGLHTIRIQHDGYLDVEEQVNISSTTGALSYTLKKNKNVKEIHATPVTIYSKSSRIYKNYKLIKEWTNGATIKFMPGKYLLTDDSDNEKEIVVGTEPMTIRF
jgi:hypothetical protein